MQQSHPAVEANNLYLELTHNIFSSFVGESLDTTFQIILGCAPEMTTAIVMLMIHSPDTSPLGLIYQRENVLNCSVIQCNLIKFTTYVDNTTALNCLEGAEPLFIV